MCKHALYIKNKNKDKDILTICLYAIDLIFTRSNPSIFGDFKKVITKEFEMINIGLITYSLSIEISQKEDEIVMIVPKWNELNN